MAKYATYNNVEMTISHTSSYGRYRLSALIDGERITAETTDSEIYDYFDCDYYEDDDIDVPSLTEREKYELQCEINETAADCNIGF